METILAKALLELDKSKAEELAWEYFKLYPTKWRGNSKQLNKKTELFTCCSLINFGYPPGTILHFTQEDIIHGTSDMFGNEPVFYESTFDITREKFTLSYYQLKQGKIRFEPKDDFK